EDGGRQRRHQWLVGVHHIKILRDQHLADPPGKPKGERYSRDRAVGRHAPYAADAINVLLLALQIPIRGGRQNPYLVAVRAKLLVELADVVRHATREGVVVRR